MSELFPSLPEYTPEGVAPDSSETDWFFEEFMPAWLNLSQHISDPQVMRDENGHLPSVVVPSAEGITLYAGADGQTPEERASTLAWFEKEFEAWDDMPQNAALKKKNK